MAANELCGGEEEERLPANCAARMSLDWLRGYPPRNVWIGTSVEDQTRAYERIPKLLQIPARVRFLSCEPLLGPLDLWLDTEEGIHWLIVGGESGPGARIMREDWALSLRDQAVKNNVAFHFKQWGGSNKKAAGRELGGRTWDELPLLMVPEYA